MAGELGVSAGASSSASELKSKSAGEDSSLCNKGETAAHAALKRAALLWAQARGYSACAMEVSLPRCRFRADVAAYRASASGAETTAIFECKQALVDLRRNDCDSATTRARLEAVCRRRAVIERHLRVHYPAARVGESLFAEFDRYDFSTTGHSTHKRLLRETRTLQNRLFDGTKFETLLRYRCANLFFLVLPREWFCETLVPAGWGALIEEHGALELTTKAPWHDNTAAERVAFLHKVAVAGTRLFNRATGIAFDEVMNERALRV